MYQGAEAPISERRNQAFRAGNTPDWKKHSEGHRARAERRTLMDQVCQISSQGNGRRICINFTRPKHSSYTRKQVFRLRQCLHRTWLTQWRYCSLLMYREGKPKIYKLQFCQISVDEKSGQSRRMCIEAVGLRLR